MRPPRHSFQRPECWRMGALARRIISRTTTSRPDPRGARHRVKRDRLPNVTGSPVPGTSHAQASCQPTPGRGGLSLGGGRSKRRLAAAVSVCKAKGPAERLAGPWSVLVRWRSGLGHFAGVLDDLVDGAGHVEGLLGKLVVLAIQD